MTWAKPSPEEQHQRRQAEREQRMTGLLAAHLPPYQRVASGDHFRDATKMIKPMPKPVEHRNSHLLTLARGQRCLLRIPGVCMGNTETTVACHSNSQRHGKAGARKADDQYSTWGCMACHRWLDQGPASYEEKTEAFLRAHARQVLEWRKIVADGARAPRDRRAAHWALMLLADVPVDGSEIPDQADIAAQEADR